MSNIIPYLKAYVFSVFLLFYPFCLCYNRPMIKKADIILFILILAVGLFVSFGPLANSALGSEVRITVDGELYGIYDLMEDQKITIENDGHVNVVDISGGSVHMDSASCHNQICVGHAPISISGDSIVCMPNRVVVEITGSEGGDVDVISG